MLFFTHTIEIASLCLTYRVQQLLNFLDWPEWLTTGLAVTPQDKGKQGSELGPGDRLRSDFRGTVVKPKILVCACSPHHSLANYQVGPNRSSLSGAHYIGTYAN
jgi:hypothetical protein